MSERKYIEPQPSAETQPFWDGAKQGKLLVRSCRSCDKAHWYPRNHCPLCGSRDLEWIEASGKGEVYSYSYMRRADPPYVMAYVTLAEGPTMMTNLVECDADKIRIGDKVQVKFIETSGGVHLPMFTPQSAVP